MKEKKESKSLESTRDSIATKVITKNAHEVVKSFAAEKASVIFAVEEGKKKEQQEKVAKNQEMHVLESEVMGAASDETRKQSDLVERNLKQMVNVLNLKMRSLEEVAKTRMSLCEEDLNANSRLDSMQGPKITDDLGMEASKPEKVVSGNIATSGTNAYSIRTLKMKKNLVSSDDVYIDPYHLVLRTKPNTEIAKKIESKLDEIYSSHIQVWRGKKQVNNNAREKLKKSEAKKNEMKKQARVKLEKKLQSYMEQFITRSILDNDLNFSAPPASDDASTNEVKWPISIKWPTTAAVASDSTQHIETIDGEMDIDLLLTYAILRSNLPSSEGMFKWLMHQPMFRNYFIILFWIVKIKFFQSSATAYDEAYLLRAASVEYSKIVELIASRAYTEHEKDFSFKFLPFIYTNAIYFSCYYLCPSSRHMYTKGFKKTVYMQIVQIMYGFQLCPVSVKVTWSKMFPEDDNDVADEQEDGAESAAESFPVQAAYSSSRRIENLGSTFMSQAFTSQGPENLADTHDFIFTGTEDDPNQLAGSRGAKFTGMMASEGATPSHPHITRASSPVDFPSTDDHIGTYSSSDAVDTEPSSKVDIARSLSANATSALAKVVPVSRTMLKPLPSRPPNVYSATFKQNVERMEAKEMSPLIQQFLSSDFATGVRGSQKINRTVPVAWCAVGGSDTHRKPMLNTDLHNDIAMKFHKSVREYKKQTMFFYKDKMKQAQEVEKNYNSLIHSGHTLVSRFSGDLIRRQRNGRGELIKEKQTTKIDVQVDELPTNLHQFLNDDFDVEEFLATL